MQIDGDYLFIGAICSVWFALGAVAGDHHGHRKQKIAVDDTVCTQGFDVCTAAKIRLVDMRGINPDYLLAMAVLETGHGTGNIYAHTHNLFSIKAKTGYPGKTYFSGDYYRSYRSDIESIEDVVIFLTEQERYKQAYTYALMDEREKFFSELQRVGYSESDKYAANLERIFTTLKRSEASGRLNKFPSLAHSSSDRTTH